MKAPGKEDVLGFGLRGSAVTVWMQVGSVVSGSKYSELRGQHCPLVAILQTTGRAAGSARRAAAVKSPAAQHLSVCPSVGARAQPGPLGQKAW